MMQQITQKHRLIAVTTPLKEDQLVFRRMTATEQLGRLSEFQLELFSENDRIEPERLLGQNMTVRAELPEDRERFFNGYVSRFSYVGTRGRYAVYHATLRPWLWFLTRTADCRIFQHKTVPEIVKAVFDGYDFADFRLALTEQYRQWEYCVQYRETDFNFVSRLLEQEGIYYYFEHEDGRHTLVLSDSYCSHNHVPGYEQVPYYRPERRPHEDRDHFVPGARNLRHEWTPDLASQRHDERERGHIFDWSVEQRVQPGAYALDDFDFKAPRKCLRNSSCTPREHAQSKLELFDYPGEYLESGDGQKYARLRMEEQQAQCESIRGESNAVGLSAGALFNLTDYPREDQNREYLITSATYELQSEEYESVGGMYQGPVYSCAFSALDARQPYRPPRITPKPVVQGVQTAIVVGKAGEEIWTDQYGRVKCQFHWDRYGAANESSSCWIRVAQIWAGKKWGGIYIPRIGQEVIVDFLEGDPDRPIITGCVYNGANMPPYDLPANKTQSGIKSRSSKGGTQENFNEIRFEDKKGSEEIYVHAERNLKTVVEADEIRAVGGHRTTTVFKDETLVIKEGNRSETLEKGNDKLVIQKGDRNVDILEGNDVLFVQQGDIEQSAPAGTFRVDANDIAITGFTSLKLVCGASTIEMTPASITINSPMVKLNC